MADDENEGMQKGNGDEAEETFNLEENKDDGSAEQETQPPDGETEPVAQVDDGEFSREFDEMQEIQRTCSTVINEFEGDSSVEKILDEYKKLYETLKTSYVAQRRIVFENSCLRCEIKNNAEKVHLAIHLAQEDKEIISNLTRQVHQAWNEVESVAEKESRARSVILKLQDEISQLTSLVEHGSGIQELHTVAHLAVLERKELEDSLLQLKTDLEFKELKIQEVNERMAMKEESNKKELSHLNSNIKANDKKFVEVQKKLQEMEEYSKMLERVRANLNAENSNCSMELDACKMRVHKLEKDEVELKAEIVKVHQSHNEQYEMNCEKTKELSKLNSDIEVLKRRVITLHQTNNSLKERMDEKETSTKICERSLKKREAEVDVMEKKYKQTSQTIRNLQYHMIQREEKLKLEKETVHSLHMTLNDAQNRLKKIQMNADEFKRTADFAKQHYVTLAGEKSSLQEKLELKERSNVALIKELNIVTTQLHKAMDHVHVMESDKERLYGRINTVLEMVNSLAGDNDNKETKLLMLLKVNNEQETHINHINTKLFRMTNQRDNISNELHLIQLKNDELNLANHNFSKQSSSLAEDLHHKESELDKMRAKNSVLRNDIRSLENDIVQWQDENYKKKIKIDDLEMMIRNMDVALCKKEQDIGKLRLVLDQMVNQRNLLGFQCLKKKEHILLLTEKNTLMQDIFRSGNRAYNNQSKLVSQLQINIRNLLRQKTSLLNRMENVENYKSKLGLANQQLVGALARSLAMEGENPFNLHRWRHLKAVDISQYEMIIKVQYLLKRCIMKTDEVTQLEHIVLEKTAIVTEMRRILERRPGIEYVRKAKADEKAKEDLKKKLKTAMAERNMNSAKLELQSNKNRHLADRLTDERKKSIELNKSNIKLMTKVSKLPAIGHTPCTVKIPRPKCVTSAPPASQ